MKYCRILYVFLIPDAVKAGMIFKVIEIEIVYLLFEKFLIYFIL